MNPFSELNYLNFQPKIFHPTQETCETLPQTEIIFAAEQNDEFVKENSSFNFDLQLLGPHIIAKIANYIEDYDSLTHLARVSKFFHKSINSFNSFLMNDLSRNYYTYLLVNNVSSSKCQPLIKETNKINSEKFGLVFRKAFLCFNEELLEILFKDCRYNENCLSKLVNNQNCKTLIPLIQNIQSVVIKGNFFHSVLKVAIEEDWDSKLFQAILKEHQPVNYQEHPLANKNFSNKLLNIAISKKKIEKVQILLEDKRFDPTENNQHSFKLAYTYNKHEIVDLLIKDKRIKPSAEDNEAYQWALKRNWKQMCDILLQDTDVANLVNATPTEQPVSETLRIPGKRRLFE